MNILATIIGYLFHLSLRQSLLIISLISPALVIMFVKMNKLYNYTQIEWYHYYIIVYILNIILYNIIIYSLMKLIKC